MGHLMSDGEDLDQLVDAVATRVESRVTDMIVRLTFLGLFVFWALDLVGPFLPVAIWAVILAVALQPVHAWLAARLGGARRLAAVILTVVFLAIIIGPVALLATSMTDALQALTQGIDRGTLRVPPPPAGIEGWPLIGEKADAVWSLAERNLDAAVKEYAPTLLTIVTALLHRLATMSLDVLLLCVSVIIAGFLYVSGRQLAEGGRAFAERVVASRGAAFVDLAGLTIRNVSRGVIGVAVIQSLLAGIVLAVAGIPAAGLLAFVMLILCIVQIGPAPVLLPLLVWAWVQLTPGVALVLTVVLLPIMVIDNVLKPLLMGRGLRTPTLVILIGVLGGTITHGLLGLFLGPVVLSVLYELLVAWVRRAPPPASTIPLAPEPSVGA